MSVSLNVKAFSSDQSPEFQKHFKAVQFCIENDLSYPIETSAFFKGKINCGLSLEDYAKGDHVIGYIQNGVEVPLPHAKNYHETQVVIKVADIPSSVDEIIVKLS